MFTSFFFLLRAYGVPVTITEWMMLMRALSEGLALSSLDRFYSLARSILVKSETFYDQYDQAFAACFEGIETPVQIADEVWDWLADPQAMPGLSEAEKRELAALMADLDLDELQRLFEQRLAEQDEAHHGGNRWVGTGGTSPFGHSGFHPGGIRVGGESRNRSAVKVAGERRYRGYRTDVKVGVRQFELALRRLRQLTSRNEGLADELDLDETVDETADHAGRSRLVWHKSRKNSVKVLLAMDVGGSMHPYIRLCSQLFSAVNSQTHFKDLKTYYFHDCIYDWLYLDTDMTTRNAVSTNRVVHELPPTTSSSSWATGPWRPASCSADTASSGGAAQRRARHRVAAPSAPALRALGVAQHHPPGPVGVGLRRPHDRLDPSGPAHVRAARSTACRPPSEKLMVAR